MQQIIIKRSRDVHMQITNCNKHKQRIIKLKITKNNYILCQPSLGTLEIGYCDLSPSRNRKYLIMKK